jgi:glycosyltransferase involved in cell wall biosynthesis
MTPTTSPMHVLYVSWGFPPHRGPGTYRGLATVNALAAAGHRVTVLTADLATFEVITGADLSLLDRIHPDVEVVRVPFPAGRRDPIITRWTKQRAMTPKDWRELMTARERSAFPEAVYGLWKQRAEAAAYRLHRTDPVDLVIATGNPYVDFAPAFHLGVELDVPYVLDDRDAWLLDVYTGEEHEPGGAAERLWEAMQRRCLQAWFVNPPIANWYRTRFPESADKVHVVENGWDSSFLSAARVPRPARQGAPVLGFVGTISAGLPVELLLKAWKIAQPRLGEGAELRFYGQLGHSGAGESDRVRLFAEHEALGVRHLGRWPKTQIDEAYESLDVLLFAKEGGKLVTSGKVYEYVATGKPIVCAIEEEHDARRVLAEYPRRHDPTKLTPKALADAYVAAAQDAQAATPALVHAALEAGERFERSALLHGPLLDVLERARALKAGVA